MKKGKTPSLIGSTLGSCKIVQPGPRGPLRRCKRCDAELVRDKKCIQVSIPGSLGHKSFCPSCFDEILDSSQAKLDSLRREVTSIA
jgi:hypothetical protein